MKFDIAHTSVSRLRACSQGLGWGLLWLGCSALAHAAPPDATQPWSLQATLSRVQEASRDLLSAQRAVDAARADLRTAGITPASQLSLLSQAINTQNLGHGSAWNRPVDTIVRLDTLMERGDKRAHRERQAQAGLLAAQSDVADVQRQQQIAAAQAYWDLKRAQVQQSSAIANAQIAQESSRIAQTRLRQGDLSQLEATRLAMEADRALNEADQAASEFDRARTTLTQVLALDRHTPLLASDDWPRADTTQPFAANGDADEAWLAQRTDVVAARQRLAQAQEALSLAQAQRSTDVTWSVQFEHNPPVGNRLWGVGVSIPLGVEGRQEGPVARAVVALADAQAAVERTEASARAEQAVLLATLQTAARRVQRLDGELLPKAREAVKAAEFARQQGALSLQDVLDTRRLAHAAELDAAQAHADHAKALAALTLTSNTPVVTP